MKWTMVFGLGLLAVGCAGSSSSSSTGGAGSAFTTLGNTGPSASGSQGTTSSSGQLTSTVGSTSGSAASTSSGSVGSGTLGSTSSSASGGTGGSYQLAVAEGASVSVYQVSATGAQAIDNFAVGGPIDQLKWSPVSNEIGVAGYFGSSGYSGYSGYYEYSSNVYSETGSPLASFGAQAFDWSPDGSQLVILDSQLGIDTAEIASGAVTGPLESGQLAEPAWAPAGDDRISFLSTVFTAYTEDTQLIVRAAPSGTSARFVAGDQVQSYQWSPDGTRIAFFTPSLSGYACDLGVVQLTSVGVTSTAPLVQNADCDGSVAWSPDSTQVVLGTSNVYVVSASASPMDFSNLTGLLANPRSILQLEWTPDGRYIGFLANSSTYYSGQTDFLLEPSSGGTPLAVLPGVSGLFFDLHR